MHHFICPQHSAKLERHMTSDGYAGETDIELYGEGRVFYVKHCKPNQHRAFANNKWDNGEGVLLESFNCVVPLFNEELERPDFSDIELDLPKLPSLNERVVCDISQGPRGRYYADFWTPERLWLLADEQYTMWYVEANGAKTIKVWEDFGIYDLSRYFPSNTWEGDDGTVWRSSDGTVVYKLTQVDLDHKGRGFDVVPATDPRLKLDWLPQDCHGLSMLPQE